MPHNQTLWDSSAPVARDEGPHASTAGPMPDTTVYDCVDHCD